MDDDNDIGCLVVFSLLGVAVGLGWFTGGLFAESSAHRAAIEAGVAEYRVDAQTGETEFVYLTFEEMEARRGK